jgi:hypothetical protein
LTKKFGSHNFSVKVNIPLPIWHIATDAWLLKHTNDEYQFNIPRKFKLTAVSSESEAEASLADSDLVQVEREELLNLRIEDDDD